jgi:hypothetical protein
VADRTPRVARLRKRQGIDSVVFKRAGLRDDGQGSDGPDLQADW